MIFFWGPSFSLKGLEGWFNGHITMDVLNLRFSSRGQMVACFEDV